MGEASRLLATLALNATWQLLVVVTAAAAADLLLRRAPARTRHALWASTVLLAAALPLLAFVPRRAPPVRPAVRLPEAPSLLAASAVPPAAEASLRLSVSVPGSAGLALIGLLVVAGGLRGSRLLLALRRATRLRRSAREERSEKVHSLALECAEALTISPVPVLSAPGLDGPITVGALRPVILLPPGFASAHDDDAIRAALGHELAHVKRRDYGLNLAFEVALLPFAWHPAARVLRRRLGETREMACDELASESLLGPRRYARSLVDVASGILRTTPSPALGVDDAGILEDRIRHLLRPHGTSPARRHLGIAAGVALLLATSLFASFAVVEAKPLPAAPAEWRSQMKNVVGAMMLALALPASGDDLTKGLEALKAGDLVVAAASVERAVAANPRDRDALYTLGVIRWQDAYNVLGAAKKVGTLDAERDRLKKTVTLGHDALRRASAIDPNLWAALLYESLLCRLDAEIATDPAEVRTHLARADETLAKAKQMKASGVTSTAPRADVPMPPPPPPPKKAQALPPPPPPPAS